MTKLTELKLKVYLRRLWPKVRGSVCDSDGWGGARFVLSFIGVVGAFITLVVYGAIYAEYFRFEDGFITTLRFSTWGFFFHLDSLASYDTAWWSTGCLKGLQLISLAGWLFLVAIAVPLLFILKDVIVALVSFPGTEDIARYTSEREYTLRDMLVGTPSYLRRDLTHIGALRRSHEELLEYRSRDEGVITHFTAEVDELTARADALKEWETRLRVLLERIDHLLLGTRDGFIRLMDAYEKQRKNPNIRDVSPALIRDIEAAAKKLCFYLSSTAEILGRDYRTTYPAVQLADVEDLVRGFEAGGVDVRTPAAPSDMDGGEETFDEDDL